MIVITLTDLIVGILSFSTLTTGLYMATISFIEYYINNPNRK